MTRLLRCVVEAMRRVAPAWMSQAEGPARVYRMVGKRTAGALVVLGAMVLDPGMLHSGAGGAPQKRPEARSQAVVQSRFALADPTRNVVPQPNIYAVCSNPGSVGIWAGTVCTAAEEAAIDRARAEEGLGPIQLPRGWAQLSPAEQIFVITNIERTDRGLAPFVGLAAELNQEAQVGALHETDALPSVMSPGILQWASNWALAPGPLGADYAWMYQDGWGGSANETFNLACTGPGARGCWGHRQNVLMRRIPGARGVLVMGAASAPGPNGWVSLTEVLVQTTQPMKLYYTWAEAVAAGAR
jgi:hypothetical protein